MKFRSKKSKEQEKEERKREKGRDVFCKDCAYCDQGIHSPEDLKIYRCENEEMWEGHNTPYERVFEKSCKKLNFLNECKGYKKKGIEA